MELCETSLYHVLEYPENYYGLSETEFKYVLRDVGKMNLTAFFIEINMYSLKQKTKTGTHFCSLFDGVDYRRIHDMSFLQVDFFSHEDTFVAAARKEFEYVFKTIYLKIAHDGICSRLLNRRSRMMKKRVHTFLYRYWRLIQSNKNFYEDYTI